MNTESRINNSIKNSIFGIIVQVSNVLLGFATRTVFVKCLSTEYLGVNGLFTNILTMLSLAELGVGSAIVYNMYKPISENDTVKIAKLMNLYRDAYRIIGCVVAVIGLCLVPFLDYIIKDQPNIDGLTSVSYTHLAPTINGDGNQSRDFTYIENVIEANLKGMVSGPEVSGEVFNVAYGGREELIDIYNKLCDLLGKHIEPEYGPDRAGDIKHSNADISKARQMLGYDPDYDFAKGIELAVDWYKENL